MIRRTIAGLLLAALLVAGSLFIPSATPSAIAAPAAQTQEESHTLAGGACVLLHPVDETGDVQVCHLTYWFRLQLHHYYTITQNGTKIETPEGITMYWETRWVETPVRITRRRTITVTVPEKYLIVTWRTDKYTG